jgi:hypothetical protein
MTVLATPNFRTSLNLCDLYRHPHWSKGVRAAPSIHMNALQSIWHLLPTTKIHGWLGVSGHVTRLPHRMMVDQHVIHSSYGAVRRGGPTASWIHSVEEIHCHDCLWLCRAFKPCFFYHFSWIITILQILNLLHCWKIVQAIDLSILANLSFN